MMVCTTECRRFNVDDNFTIVGWSSVPRRGSAAVMADDIQSMRRRKTQTSHFKEMNE